MFVMHKHLHAILMHDGERTWLLYPAFAIHLYGYGFRAQNMYTDNTGLAKAVWPDAWNRLDCGHLKQKQQYKNKQIRSLIAGMALSGVSNAPGWYL